MAADATRQPHPTRFLRLFALAWAGGSIAYVPFLTLLLPLRILALAGPDSVRVLARITFFGAIAASSGNILFGWLSDRTGVRRPWIAAGLVMSSLLLLAMPFLQSFTAILLVVMLWQLALNMMLGPLWAWAADMVPRESTGLVGGLMSFAPSAGALAGVIITIPGLASFDQRFLLIALMVGASVAPVLLMISSKPPEAPQIPTTPKIVSATGSSIILMWLARLLLQIAEATLFAYLLVYFVSIDPNVAENRVAALFGCVLVVAIPLSLVSGGWADRTGRPIQPLAVLATVAAMGLIALTAASTIAEASIAYVVFGVATNAFLSLHSGQTLRVLPSPNHRGRDLGLFNLTNTIPSLIMPWLTILLVPRHGFSALFLLLSLLAVCSAALLFSIKRLD
jgi:MFS family permease